ncbi:hypothetical protein [Tissierella praeacuta]|uniref:hypothetical protein n=1 Tax=Tissierella praeacuta TaxID=43131 RepID=UPI0028B0AF61|nr:hypothetical protein [Tissierella praeacuta]
MNLSKRIFKFQNYDSKRTIGVFWGIILLINISVYILTLYYKSRVRIGLMNNDHLSIAGSNIMPIFIFFIVNGIIMYHEYFSLALSFGVTRKDFYKSVIVDNVIVSFIFAVIQGVLLIMDKYIAQYSEYKPIVNFGLFNTSTNNILFIILSLTTIFLVSASIINLIGVLQYRFGYKLWIGFGIMFFIVQLLGGFFIKLVNTVSKMYLYLESIFNNFTVFTVALLIIIVFYILGYIFIREAGIRE